MSKLLCASVTPILLSSGPGRGSAEALRPWGEGEPFLALSSCPPAPRDPSVPCLIGPWTHQLLVCSAASPTSSPCGRVPMAPAPAR